MENNDEILEVEIRRRIEIMTKTKKEKQGLSLYDLTGEYLEILEMLEDPEADEEKIQLALDGLAGSINSKFDGYMKIYKIMEKRKNALKEEEDRIKKRRNQAINSMERIKNAIKQAMLITEQDKIETDLFTASIAEGPGSVVIDDPEEIPEEFLIPQDPTVDKKKLKQFLLENENQDFEYAHIQKDKTIRFF